MDEFSEPVSEEELAEFLEADGVDVRADPIFERRLRRRLWRLVTSTLRWRNRRGRESARRAPRASVGPPPGVP